MNFTLHLAFFVSTFVDGGIVFDLAYHAMKNFVRATRVAGMVRLIASIMIGEGKKIDVPRIDNQSVRISH